MIKGIKVEGLFGIFDHPVTLFENDGVTIMHGPNGSGKSTILKMLYHMFHKEFEIFFEVPFYKFSVEVNNDVIVLQKINNEKIKVISVNKAFEEFEINKKIENSFYDLSSKYIRKLVVDNSQKYYNKIKPIQNYNIILPSIEESSYDKNYPIFCSIVDSVKVLFITSERLMEETEDGDDGVEYKPKVSRYPEELIAIISEYNYDYAKVSQSLDRSFPIRVIKLNKLRKRARHNTDELIAKMIELSQKSARLISKGIISEATDQEYYDFSELKPEDFSDSQLLRLMLENYIEDNEKKLSVFDSLLERVVLFEEMINSYFKYKRINVNHKNGFSIIPTKGLSNEPILPEKLSSGEQHYLVLLYELVFNSTNGSTIMIDEPEISLHISWQIDLVDNLKKISKLNNLRFLLATHSPSIIRNHRESTISIGYDEDE